MKSRKIKVVGLVASLFVSGGAWSVPANGAREMIGVKGSTQPKQIVRPQDTSIWLDGRVPSADNTVYVWRWQKVYPEGDSFCPNTQGVSCSNSIAFAKQDSVTDTVTTTVTLSPSAWGIGSVAAAFSRAWLKSDTYTFESRVTVPPGHFSYAGVISAVKSITNTGRFRGVWILDENAPKTVVSGLAFGEYVYDRAKESGSWTGRIYRHTVKTICVTKTVGRPKVDDGMVSECRPPVVTYG